MSCKPWFLGSILTISTLTLLAPGPVSPALQSASEASERSPHIEAMNLVFRLKADDIRKIDIGDWWTDTDERSWSVRRMIPPGTFDSTHWFFVMYRRNSELLCVWSVDTRAETVELSSVEGEKARCE